MVTGLLIAAALLAGPLGFLAGLLTRKRSTRWCQHCGVTLTCAVCPAATSLDVA